MRSVYLIAYDVRDDKRRDRVFKILRGFGDHLQFSVFRVEATDSELVRLRARLVEAINNQADSVLLADLGPADGRGVDAVATIGVPCLPAGGREAVIW